MKRNHIREFSSLQNDSGSTCLFPKRSLHGPHPFYTHCVQLIELVSLSPSVAPSGARWYSATRLPPPPFKALNENPTQSLKHPSLIFSLRIQTLRVLGLVFFVQLSGALDS